MYRCNGCKKDVPYTKKVGKDRKQNVFVDHIKPVVDPKRGFVNWDEFIKRLFCEEKNLQLLCKSCHDEKTAQEKELRIKWKKKNIPTSTK